MYLYDENSKEIFHSDSFGDVIEHYGVKGMHCGTRKGKAITAKVNKKMGKGVEAYLSTVGKSAFRAARNPIHSMKSSFVNGIKHPIMSRTSPVTMYKKRLGDTMSSIERKKKDKAAKKKYKEAKKKALLTYDTKSVKLEDKAIKDGRSKLNDKELAAEKSYYNQYREAKKKAKQEYKTTKRKK